MLMKLIKKIIENDYDNIICSIFYFMILFFMPFSSVHIFILILKARKSEGYYIGCLAQAL